MSGEARGSDATPEPEQRLAELGLDLELAQALCDLALCGRMEAAVAERACPELERRGLVRLGAEGYEPTDTGVVVARQLEAVLSPPDGSH